MPSVLILSDRHPCPPRNGLYVPLYEMLRRLRKIDAVRIDLALPCTPDCSTSDSEGDHRFFDQIYRFALRKRPLWRRILDLVLFRLPPYSLRLDIPNSIGDYDFVIATPDGFAETLECIKKRSPSTFTILWINEPYSTVSLGQFLNAVYQGPKAIPLMAISALKYLFVYQHEKRYLRRVDGIVVQTHKELVRLERILGSGASRRKVLICANPVKQELLDLPQGNGHVLLIQAPRNVDEVREFVTEVSRYLESAADSCVIRICAADTGMYSSVLGTLPSVEFMGYQENIAAAYRDVFCSVVFTRQRFGLVNRVKEGMAAGAAVIGFPEALQTLGPVEDGTNVVFASDAKAFIDRAKELIRDRERAGRIGTAARRFIISSETCGPDQLIDSLFPLYSGKST